MQCGSNTPTIRVASSYAQFALKAFKYDCESCSQSEKFGAIFSNRSVTNV